MASSEPASVESQCAAAVLMVRPAHFGFNAQTAGSNGFQHIPGAAQAGIGDAAMREFDGLAAALRRTGVEVIDAADTAAPPKPDAVFPNNWLSFHADGTVVLYPMLAANRRAERREEIIAQVVQRGGFRVTRTVDLSPHEATGRFLEGTGSLVLDRTGRKAYAALSPRTDLDVLGDFAQQLDYDLVTFDAHDAQGRPLYHTNVLMAIGARCAVVCGEAITDPAHRAAVFARIGATHEIVDISRTQMTAFAGNILELRGSDGPVTAMSAGAFAAFDGSQRRVLQSHGSLVTAEIPTIEHVGGGSVRCMLAEIHLPRR